ncbi:MAG: urease accessory protein UreE [Rhodobacteraceae bacterium]|nr:urease accessory protein UreE [Paracoccaceae bacterium]
MTLPTSREIRHSHRADGQITLSYDDRFLRRKVLTTDTGEKFLVDLERTTSLNGGDVFVLDDGRQIAVAPAPEALLQVKGDLARLAWHIGNRHMPAQIEADRILIQRDHVIKAMLAQLGADLTDVTESFTPLGGAYGHGRTHGHSHGDAFGNLPAHNHDHSHDH